MALCSDVFHVVTSWQICLNRPSPVPLYGEHNWGENKVGSQLLRWLGLVEQQSMNNWTRVSKIETPNELWKGLKKKLLSLQFILMSRPCGGYNDIYSTHSTAQCWHLDHRRERRAYQDLNCVIVAYRCVGGSERLYELRNIGIFIRCLPATERRRELPTPVADISIEV